MYKFLRVINGEEYEDFLCEQGIYKYMPRRLLHTLQMNIKPRILCKYITQDLGEEIGIGVGVFINQDNISSDEYKSKLIDTINNIKEQEGYEGIEFLLDDNTKLDIDEIEEVKELCNIQIPQGREVFASNILNCLEKICKHRDEQISEKEVFILSDDTKVTEDLVNELASSTKFISIYSENNDFAAKLEVDVFKKTGLALHVRRDMSEGCEDFNFIINLSEDALINLSNLKKNKIVIDLSRSKCLAYNKYRGKSKAILIDDLFFKNDSKIYSESGKFEFDKYLNTATHKLFCENKNDIEKVQINNRICSVEQLVELSKFKKQDESCFKKT